MATSQPVFSASVRHQFGQEVAFLQRLVRARSANPFVPEASRPDVPIEVEVAPVIQEELRQLEWSARTSGISPQRPNVLCRIPSTGPAGKT